MNLVIATILYILLFIGILYYLDEYIYDKSTGDIRQFGVFYKKESLFTMFPLLIGIVFFSFFVAYLFF
jgi:hypothetical protein